MKKFFLFLLLVIVLVTDFAQQKNTLLTDLVNAKSITDSLNKLLEDRFGAKDLVRSEITDQVDFDIKKINAQHLDFDAIKKATTNFLQQQPGIMYAIDMTKIGEAPIPEPLKAMLINEFQAKQSAAHTLSWCCRRYRQGHRSWYFTPV